MLRLRLRLSHPLVIATILVVILNPVVIVSGLLFSEGNLEMQNIAVNAILLSVPVIPMVWFLAAGSRVSMSMLGVCLILNGMLFLLMALLSFLVAALLLGVTNIVVAILLFVTQTDRLQEQR